MLKRKTKRYHTKKKRKELHKRLCILSVTVIGIASIGISYIGNITPTAVLAHDIVTIDVKHTETSIIEPQSLQEHVYNLLIEEMSFKEAMVGMAIVHCESHWDKMAIGANSDSLDLGLWQLNTKFQEISREDSFDVYASTRYAIQLYKDWGDWSAWTCNNKI